MKWMNFQVQDMPFLYEALFVSKMIYVWRVALLLAITKIEAIVWMFFKEHENFGNFTWKWQYEWVKSGIFRVYIKRPVAWKE